MAYLAISNLMLRCVKECLNVNNGFPIVSKELIFVRIKNIYHQQYKSNSSDIEVYGIYSQQRTQCKKILFASFIRIIYLEFNLICLIIVRTLIDTC